MFTEIHYKLAYLVENHKSHDFHMFYRNNKFNESSKGEWIDIFISLYLYVCFLVR